MIHIIGWEDTLYIDTDKLSFLSKLFQGSHWGAETNFSKPLCSVQFGSSDLELGAAQPNDLFSRTVVQFRVCVG